MAGKKFFVRNFESFKGLDLSKSFLSRDPAFAFEYSNVELDDQNSLKEIDGFKVAASTVRDFYYTNAGVKYTENGPIWGLKRYVYQDTTTGETKEELIGIGNGMWKLAKGRMTVDGPANSTISISHSPTSTVITYKVSGTAVRTKTVSGEGLSYSAGQRIIDIVDDANSNLGGSGWTITVTPNAVVNGAQSAIVAGNSVTVVSGHTITAQSGEFVRLPFECYQYNNTDKKIMWVDIINPQATSLTIIALNETCRRLTSNVFNKCNTTTGHVIGCGIVPAHHLPTVTNQSCATATDIEFYYWEQIYVPSYSGTLLLGSLHELDDEKSRLWYPQQQNYCAVNMSNCLYVGSPIALWTDDHNNNFEAGMVKYDGQSCYLAGLPTPNPPSLSLNAVVGTGFDNGVYKYLIQYKFVDARGNITYSNASLLNGESSISATNGATNNTVTVTFENGYVTATGRPVLKYAQGVVNGLQSLTTGSTSRTLTVNSDHSIRVGDFVCYLDNTSGELRRKKVLSATSTTITMEFASDDPTDSLANNDIVAQNHTVEIYRTKANGQTYYLVVEKPAKLNSSTSTHTDSTTDANLGFEWLGPYTGDARRDMPPPGPLLEVHQNKIVVGGYSKSPNTLSWSGLESCEYFPRGTNATDLMSTATGPATAMASTGADSLLVWKESSLLTVVGDLYSGAVFTATAQEGDVGCPSSSGWCRVRDSVLWMSPFGLRGWSNGQLTSFDDRVKSRFPSSVPNQTYNSTWSSAGLLAKRAVAFNDPYNQRAIFFVPYEASTSGPLSYQWVPTTSSKFFVLDYTSDSIAEWDDSLTSSPVLNAAGGIEWYNGEIFMLGRIKHEFADYVQSYLFVQRPTGTLYGDPAVSLQWEFMNEPSFPKDFLSLKLWKLNDTDNEHLTTTVRVYDDFKTSTYETMSFVYASGDYWTEYPLSMRDRAAIAFRFSSGGKNPFRLSGFELTVAVPYRKERTDFEP